jgi:hypothetical protein
MGVTVYGIIFFSVTYIPPMTSTDAGGVDAILSSITSDCSDNWWCLNVRKRTYKCDQVVVVKFK